MWTRTQILVLSAAVSVLFGCAPLPIPLVRSAPPVVVSPQETQLYSPPPQLPFLVESNAAPEASIEHARVRYFINHFSKAGWESLSKILARSGRYMPMIARILREEGLPEEFAYLALIESGFSPEVSSPNGAVGLWQFVATTA